jgi:hypothetical protein
MTLSFSNLSYLSHQDGGVQALTGTSVTVVILQRAQRCQDAQLALTDWIFPKVVCNGYNSSDTSPPD